MAEVHIVRDTKDSSVLHISMENCGNKLVQPFMLRTESWQHEGEVVWLFIEEGGFWNLVDNLRGDAVEYAASQEVVCKNLPYPQRAALTEQTIETQYQEAFFSILDFETARKFRKSNGNYLRTNQWDDLLVKVYIRK